MSETSRKPETIHEFLDMVDTSKPENLLTACVNMLKDSDPQFLSKLKIDIDPANIREVLRKLYPEQVMDVVMDETSQLLQIFVEYVFFHEEYEDRDGLSFPYALKDLRFILEGNFHLTHRAATLELPEHPAEIGQRQMEVQQLLKKGLHGGDPYNPDPGKSLN